MKKKVILTVILVSTLMGFVSLLTNEKEEKYHAGAHLGHGTGQHGEICVEVITDLYEIKEIRVVKGYEMPEIGKMVYYEIAQAAIKANSADVKVVSGASYTSQGMIDAIRDALEKARLKDEITT